MGVQAPAAETSEPAHVIHSGLCGQAPPDYPDMAEYLGAIGIESMSLNPDSVLKTTRHVLEVEERLGRGQSKRVA